MNPVRVCRYMYSSKYGTVESKGFPVLKPNKVVEVYKWNSVEKTRKVSEEGFADMIKQLDIDESIPAIVGSRNSFKKVCDGRPVGVTKIRPNMNGLIRMDDRANLYGDYNEWYPKLGEVVESECVQSNAEGEAFNLVKHSFNGFNLYLTCQTDCYDEHGDGIEVTVTRDDVISDSKKLQCYLGAVNRIVLFQKGANNTYVRGGPVIHYFEKQRKRVRKAANFLWSRIQNLDVGDRRLIACKKIDGKKIDVFNHTLKRGAKTLHSV